MAHEEIKFSLTYKFIIFVTALIVVVLSAVTYVVVTHEQEIITQKMRNSGLLLARTLANVSKGPLMQNDYTGLKGYMEDIKNDSEVAYSYIFEELNKTCVVHVNKVDSQNYEGAPFSEFTDEVSLSALNAAGEFIQTWREKKTGIRFIDISCPIIEGQTNYGKVRIGYSLKKLEEELYSTARKVIIIAVIAIILGFLVSIILARIILRPVSELVDGVDKISFGDFGHQIQVTTSDELGLLAETFNRMSYNISVLYNVSNKMNYVSDRDELLKIIMNNAIDALKAQKGSIMLLNDDRELELSLVSGHSHEMKSYIRLKMGDGVAGTVAETGQPFIINRGENDELFKKYAEFIKRSQIESLLCVPLKIEDRVIGVINIVNKKDNLKFNANDTKLMMVLGSQAAVTINKAKVYEESITDGMTKLYIHRYFQARLDAELSRAARYGTKLSLLLFDVDHFKRFNDTYGHQQGDIVLIEAAKIVKDSVRDNIDIPCRYGGEEFTIIMPETDAVGARVLAERLRKRIESYEFPGQEKPLHVTISIGVSIFPDDAADKLMLIKKSDDALYRAKEAGRNNTQIYSEMPAEEEKNVEKKEEKAQITEGKEEPSANLESETNSEKNPTGH